MSVKQKGRSSSRKRKTSKGRSSTPKQIKVIRPNRWAGGDFETPPSAAQLPVPSFTTPQSPSKVYYSAELPATDTKPQRAFRAIPQRTQRSYSAPNSPVDYHGGHASLTTTEQVQLNLNNLLLQMNSNDQSDPLLQQNYPPQGQHAYFNSPPPLQPQFNHSNSYPQHHGYNNQPGHRVAMPYHVVAHGQ
mmetsp:Transcript_3247/g.3589  ORF Transcript_3247/g.3589 Transcript_3247/m.3589 type:complete len:189 (-) Transcript_3247:421-987(-)